jgi:signal transduction histidine kinase
MGSLSNELSTDLFIKNIFTRFPQLLIIIILSSWIFERIRANQLDTLSGELQKSKESLEMESKRLERQRKFTAMLAHELKNPLMASQMALAGIQQRLASDDPAQLRAEKIKSSLQEINAIVDRCAEVDGYEQGQMPMAVHTFAVRQLLDLVEAANPSERIYTLVRDLPPGAALTSDLHYIKLILNNLLSNALKYSPPDSLVELELVKVLVNLVMNSTNILFLLNFLNGNGVTKILHNFFHFVLE